MRIAYLINQYPKASHTFIRREILAVEGHGVTVARFALRGWNEEVVDPDDRSEQTKTRYLLRGGVAPLLLSGALAMIASPAKFFRATSRALCQWRRGDRSLALNLVTVLEAAMLKQKLAAEEIEHLHAHFGTNSTQVAMLCRMLGGPSYSFTVHGPTEFDSPRQLGLDTKVANAAFVIAISRFGAGQLERWVLPRHRSRIKIVRCGLDPSFTDKDFDAPRDVRRLVCVGRLCPAKAQSLLIDVVGDLNARGLDVEVALAGDGPDRGEIETVIATRGLQDKVHLLGWLSAEQIRTEILNSRALVLASRAEGLPVVLMEALALGRPVISTYVAGIPELVATTSSGWLVPTGDRQALADAIEQCINTPIAEISAKGRRGQHFVRRYHSAATEALHLLDLFERAITNRHSVVA